MNFKLTNQAFKKLLVGATIVATAITAHVTMQEATVTGTGLPNIPDSITTITITNTSQNIYEPCRAHFNHAIFISSFYRSEIVNKAVKGVSYSQHLKGEAMDLCPDRWGGLTNEQLYKFILDSLMFDQLIMEGGSHGWVHVSYSIKKNRHQAFKIPNP